MAFDTKVPIEAGKRVLINTALPLVIGSIVVAVLLAVFKGFKR